MKLVFQRLDISEFRSFRGMATVQLEDFDPGLHYIRGVNKVEPRLGSNGAGKSTLWDALCWVLYGKTVAGLKNTDIVNWYAGKRCSVSLRLLVDGKEHKILRTASPNSWTWDDEATSAEDITSKIGLSYDIFVNTVLFGQGQPLFLDLPPKGKMDLFVDVLGLDRWDARAATAGLEAKVLEGELLVLNTEQQSKEGELKAAKVQLTNVQADAEEWEADRRKRRDEAKAKRDELRLEHEQVKKLYDEASAHKDATDAEIVHFEREVNSAIEELDRIAGEIQDHERAVGSARGEVKEMERQLAAFPADGTCPICGQDAKGTPVAKHQKELTATIKLMKARIAKRNTDELRKQHQAQIDRREQNRGFLKEWKAKAYGYEKDLNVLQPRLAELVALLQVVEKATTEADEVPNPHRHQLQDARKRVSKLEAWLGEVEKDKASSTLELEQYRHWAKGFKDIRLLIVDEVLQQLELTANGALEEMGLIGWRIEFAIEKETKSGTIQRGLTVLITEPGKAQARWEAWSGGEGQRLRLVGALALSEVLLAYAGVSINLEVLDEPTRGLSDQGVYDLCEYLAERAEQLGRLTMYVDHQSVESTLFKSVLTITKDADGSHIT